MATPRAAAIYARISLDQEGTALGVKRQVADCQALADSLGWTVGEVYEDNDVSGYSGKRRPSYERMMADVAEGRRDGVLIYHPDRLSRQPIVVERFLETLTAAGVRDVRFVASGGLDIANGDGVMVLRMLAAVAANESASKSRRIKRKNDERAAAGLPHGSSLRPFAYEKGGYVVVEAEAEVLRVVAERFLAGESLRSLCAWLDAEQVQTVAGGPWRTSGLSTTLRNPRYAGLRVHRGVVVGPAAWDAILTADQHERILARFEVRKNSGRRTPRRYLLSGLVYCGKCGGRLYSASRPQGPNARVRRYVCRSGSDHRGCGKLTVVAEPLEDLVTAAVLYRLDTPELADALAGKAAADDEAAKLTDTISEDRALLDELAAMFAAKQIGSREWMAAKQPIDDRIEDATRKVARLTHTTALGGLPGNSAAVTEDWPGLDVSRRSAIVSALVDRVIIGPGKPGNRGLDPDRVDIVWRL